MPVTIAAKSAVFSLFLVCYVGLSDGEPKRFSVEFKWKVPNYNWRNNDHYQSAINTGAYVPVNNAIAGVKIWKDRVFVTVPRWKLGVPATISSFLLNSRPADPLLEPFPNWEMQEFGNCTAFQFTQSMTIDKEDRIWILDSGRTESNVFDGKKDLSTCPAKLVIIDLKSVNFETGTFAILRRYEFPDEVASKKNNFINDIVVDAQNGVFAYISDTGADSGIVVYSFAENKSWKVRDQKFGSGTTTFDFNGVKLPQPKDHIDGIALSPPGPHRHVYYCTLGSYHIHTIPTFALQNPTSRTTTKVTDIGAKASISDGMIFDKEGNLFFGLMETNSVGVWNPRDGTLEKSQLVFDHDDETMQWPDTFAIDGNTLWVTTNRLPNFITGKVDENDVNYSILKAEIGDKTYLSAAGKLKRFISNFRNGK